MDMNDSGRDKQHILYDESLEVAQDLQRSDAPLYRLEAIDFDAPLMAVEKELEKTESAPLPNAVFDESYNFLIYATLLGIKVRDPLSIVFGLNYHRLAYQSRHDKYPVSHAHDTINELKDVGLSPLASLYLEECDLWVAKVQEYALICGNCRMHHGDAHMEEPFVDRSSLPMLHPSRLNGAKWFKHHPQVSTGVRKTIQSCFNGPWYSWKRVPPFYKRSWFSLFKKRFNWDASINYQVEREFNKLAAYRLKGMISHAKNGREKPEWILSEYWTIMQAHWATEKAKATSEKARASRMSDRNGLGPHSHRAGSRSFVRVKDVLEENNEDCSFIAVMKKTHQKPDGTYDDQRARLVAETYEKHIQERLGQLESSGEENLTAETLDEHEKNEIYIKAAGSSKHGHIFGLGALIEALPSIGASSSAPQTSEEVETITHRLQEMETDLKKSREENLQTQKRLEAMEKLVESLARQNV
ncbi:unnamed protein product [Arabidopsis arenosa]|uniref:Uncharacterized protein n=1 Tax=Arabidopsis arenosa TaxID=38785 RepID=A0A8S2AWL8_ARAAE|nr:unnamed protein product [Arabidopsis arenosa]